MTPDNLVRKPKSARRLAFGYDLFLSHNHADKDWVRELATLLAHHAYNGRPLRPWLDEQVLDPGELGRKAELTTALDRSRLIVIVLSPEAVVSKWVQYELQYFLATRSRDEIIAIRRRSCEIPQTLAGLDVLDWNDGAGSEPNFSKLISVLCPGSDVDSAKIMKEVEDAWWESLVSTSGTSGFNPTENSALLATLLKYDISAAADEGLALQAFDQAGDCMLKLNPNDSYRMKMLLGEILAAAVLKNEKYRQIAPRYLAQEPDDELHPDLSFAVLRSSSKLAEIDGRLVDPSAVWSALVKLDGVGRLFLERKAAAILGARVVGKMRGSDLGDLLIHVLTTGGQASQIGAIGGITMAEERSEPVFYLRELEEIARKKSVPSAPSVPPSQRLVALLDRIARDESDFVRQVLDNGIADLQRDFGDQRSASNDHWQLLREESPVSQINNGPIIGIVRRITAANMEEIAPELRVVDVACLTEPRIVDALLDQGAFIIEEQDIKSPLCRRLIGRDRRFAMLERRRLDALTDGDHIALEPRCTTVLPGKPALHGSGQNR
jgi:TIR domain